jgi:hypothetical protein
MKKRFTSKELLDLGLPYECEGGAILENQITGKSRWSIVYRVTFRMPDGQMWQARYSVGATESQSEEPWEYQDEVECSLVHAVQKTVTVWEPVP